MRRDRVLGGFFEHMQEYKVVINLKSKLLPLG